MKKSRKIITEVLIIIVAITIPTLYFLSPCFVAHEYYDNLPDYWHILGVPEVGGDIADSYQCAVSGDLFGNNSLCVVTNYHHGRVGIFLHRWVDGHWVRSPLYEYFVPDNPDGWPVKGVIGADVDKDGYPEIITAADVVSYPYKTQKRPFPGVIYIDLNDRQSKPQPLVWGKWGEKISNDSLAIMIPKVVDPSFRSSNNTLPDIIVKTGTSVGSQLGSRLFVLEQPPDGFAKYNYTFITPTLRGVEPYEDEPFYVKHIYVEGVLSNGTTTYSEMIFSPDEVESATTAMISDMEPIDFDHDGLVDIVVTVEYYQGTQLIAGKLIVFKRIYSKKYNYLFKKIQEITMPYFSFVSIRSANLNGNTSDGRESLIVSFRNNNSDNSLSVYPRAGIAYMIWNGSLFNIHYASIRTDKYPYWSVYGYIQVFDANRDGYDDVIVYAPSGKEYGDLLLFLNTAGKENSVFVFSRNFARILMKGQFLTWFAALEQADHDPNLELVVCLLNELPYWCPIGKKIRGAYYLDIFDAVENDILPSP